MSSINVASFFTKQLDPSMARIREQKDTIPTLRERFAALRHIPQLLRLIWSVSPALVLSTATLRLIRAFLPFASLSVGKLIIDELVRLIQSAPHAMLSATLVDLLLIEASILVVGDLSGRLISYWEGLLGDLFANDISVRLMRHAATLDMEHFEDAQFYDKLEIARQQTNGRVALMAQVFAQAQDVITLLSLLGGIALFNPWFIVIALITIVPAVISESRLNAKSYKLSNFWAPGRRLMDYYRYVGASAETAKELQMFGLSDFLSDKFSEQAQQYLKDRRRLSAQRSLFGAFFAFLGTVGYYAVYVMIIIATISSRITLGQLGFLSGSFLRVKSLMESILFSFSSIADSALYLRDLFEFFELKPRITSKPGALKVPQPITQGFVFENVSFRYANAETKVLHNLNFSLPAHKKFALVGENGSGKTTLIKLLARLYDPTEGRILLDGVDLRDYDLIDLRRAIGVIFQDFVKYQMSARDNIAVGKIDQRDELDAIHDAADRSLANTVIAKLPDGYEQMIGRRFANGAELSGGEWQKMALARAYMRSAQVLILDEPTAALDARAEHAVFQQFAQLSDNSTSIFISHRFSTVRMADRIFVLESGTILEEGSHDELIALKGRYAELFNLQAMSYR